jgi:AcrR family transcriptional regulator
VTSAKASTKDKLLQATVETLRTHGIAGISARTIAAAAEVNQALVFYHFGSVDRLLAAACTTATAERAAVFRDRFAEVGTLRELLAVGRELHATEREAGNVAVLAQLLAGAQADPKLAAATTAALDLWVRELETVLDRVLRPTPLAGVTDVPGLARAVAAAFVGIELYEGADPRGAADALDALDHLGAILEAFDDLGPVATRAVRARRRRTGKS